MTGRHVEEAAPYIAGGEAAGRDACNYAEVVGAAFEGAPEVGVSGCGRGGDGAGGQHDFVAENVGADEAEARGAKGKTACWFLCVSYVVYI